jgi:hypothetical protein
MRCIAPCQQFTSQLPGGSSNRQANRVLHLCSREQLRDPLVKPWKNFELIQRYAFVDLVYRGIARAEFDDLRAHSRDEARVGHAASGVGFRLGAEQFATGLV